MSKAEELRSKVVGTRAKPGRLVTIERDGEKLEFELRAPNMAKLARLAQECGATEKGADDADQGKMLAAVVVNCTFVPGTTERVFEPGEAEALLDAGDEWNPLFEAAARLLAPEVAELGKPSGATQS